MKLRMFSVLILVFGLSALARDAHADDTCQYTIDTLVSVGESPDLGTLRPDVLVGLNTQVQLDGVAERQIRQVNCDVITTTLGFRWSLSFQTPGSPPVDVRSSLQGRTTLTPTFVASTPGTYRATLSASGRTAEVVIVAEAIA